MGIRWRYVDALAVARGALASRLCRGGLPVDEDALTAQVGGEMPLGETLSLHVDWTGQAGDRATAQALSADLRWRF